MHNNKIEGKSRWKKLTLVNALQHFVVGMNKFEVFHSIDPEETKSYFAIEYHYAEGLTVTTTSLKLKRVRLTALPKSKREEVNNFEL